VRARRAVPRDLKANLVKFDATLLTPLFLRLVDMGGELKRRGGAEAASTVVKVGTGGVRPQGLGEGVKAGVEGGQLEELRRPSTLEGLEDQLEVVIWAETAQFVAPEEGAAFE
jgi:hypothetical protein